MPKIFYTLRHHLHFIVTVGVLAVLMTWPTLVYVFDTEAFWLPVGDSNDIWMKFWDAWYGQSLLAGEAEFYFTDLLFYPRGVSLIYHNFNVPHMLVLGGLQAIMPASNAYNLTYLILIFSTALSAYVYLLYLFQDKWISLLGTVIFGFSTHIIGHPAHPDLTLIATLPLSAYFFHRGILERRWKWMVLSGILIGLTAFIGMYIFVCILLTIGMYILYFALSRWRNPDFWLRIALLFFIVGSISMPRIYPMIHNPEDLNEALEKTGATKDKGNDLLAYFVNSRHPITEPTFQSALDATAAEAWSATSYLGYVPLVLIGFGFSRAAYRLKMLPWLILSLPFLLLRLGSVLTIKGQAFSDILLPKHYLNEIFPAIFKAFRVTDHFQIGILLPLGVLSCYGLMAMMKSVSAQRRSWIVLIFVALAAFEGYQTVEERVIRDQQLEFVQWLDKEEVDSIRLINLPMGRAPSKYYGFLQTLSGYPQAEGLASRTPAAAYAYISENLLLDNWYKMIGIQCSLSNRAEYLTALDNLLDDEFSHIVLHDMLLARQETSILESFGDVQPSYEDEFAAVYRLEDLRDSCR